MFKKALTRWLATVALAATVALGASAGERLTDWVNPYIGTGGHGHVFLGANVPFSLVQLGPTEYTHGWDWCSGYHYSDSILLGFSHTHLSGTGVGDLGDITVLPAGSADLREVKFSHDNERCRPGYYALNLVDPDVRVELTATQRVGMHRYTFGGSVETPMIILNLKVGVGWDRLTDCQIKRESSTVVTGFRRSRGWANDQIIYFAAEFDQPMELLEMSDDTISVFRLTDPDKPLLMKVALSPVSAENAKANLRAELPGWNFRATVAAADQAWEKELGRATIKTDDETVKRIFYTAMYHTMVAPSVYSDLNGDYRGSDGKVHNGNFMNYTTLSFWDTYRAQQPLMTLIHYDRLPDLAEALMRISEEGGRLPIWHLMSNETGCMVGSSGVPVLADLVLKGYCTDAKRALAEMKKSQLLEDRSLGLLKKYGYIPCDLEPSNETVAKALEYCLDDDAIAQVAKKVGDKETYNYFYKRSRSYSKYWDPETKFMRAIDSKGNWRKEFDPTRVLKINEYTEGNAWQYIWLVPHDVHGLVKLMGGEKAFISRLDELFVTEGELGEDAPPDITGLIGQYAQGNEPGHHILYLYNYVGQPWKGAKLIREVLSTMYLDNFDGLIGNEDVGQMSAWYIISAMGLYQVEPAGGKFIIGSPCVDEATMRVRGGKTFTVKAVNNSADNIYVQSARLNGKPYTKSYIMFNDIMAGGTLELTMGPTPSKWGTAKKDRP